MKRIRTLIAPALSLILVLLSPGSSAFIAAAQTVAASAGSAASGVVGASLVRPTGVSTIPGLTLSALFPAPILAVPTIAPSALQAVLLAPAAAIVSPVAIPAVLALTPVKAAVPAQSAIEALMSHSPAASADAESRPVEQQAAEARKTFDAAALKPGLSAPAVSGDAPGKPNAAPLSAPTKLLWAPQTVAAPFSEDPMGVTIHRLSNGMTVYLSPNKLQPRVTGYVAVRAGSRQDPTDSTGMAHYLEHMLFKGTERLGTMDYAKEKPHLERISALYETLFTERDPARRRALYSEIDAENQKAAAFAIPNEFDRLYAGLGFKDINAHTSIEETVYKVNFPSNRAEAWARTETERFSRPVFRLFQSELEAVYEENNMGQDNPDTALWHASQAGTFKGHPYARSTMGLSEHLKNPSLAKMYAFYDAWYRPGNMAVVLSGDFERAEMLALLERNFGTLRPRTAAAPVLPAAELKPLKGAERSEISYLGEEAVRISWRTPEHAHADVDALSVLERLLGDPQSGLLNLHLSQAHKIKSAWGGVWQLKEAGAFLLNATPREGQTLEQAEALMMAEIEKVKAGNFSDEDLRSAITNAEVEQKRGLESDDQRVKSMFQSYIAGEEWRHGVEGLARLRRVTKADLIRVASAYLGENRAVVYRRQGETNTPPIEKPGFTPITPCSRGFGGRASIELA